MVRKTCIFRGKLQFARVLGWFSRIFTPSSPQPLRLATRVTTLENLTDDFDSRLEYLASELKKIRGRQFAMEKRSQDEVQEAIDVTPDNYVQVPPAPQMPTAHLARRFRGF